MDRVLLKFQGSRKWRIGLMSGLFSGIEQRIRRLSPLSPLMFWAVTAVVVLSYADAVKTALRYHACLPRSALVEAGSILVLYPLTWTVYYRLRKRFRQLSREGMSSERLMEEVYHLSTAFVVIAYMLLGYCFWIIKDLLSCMARGT